MSDYSSNKLNLDKVSVSQILTLVKVVSDAKLNEIGKIETRYNRVAKNFTETLHFLVLCHVVSISGQSILSLSKEFRDLNAAGADVLRGGLLKTIFDRRYYKIFGLENYIKNYKITDGVYSYAPGAKARINTSGLRNLLIDLGFLEYAKEKHRYNITPNSLKYLPQASLRKFSPQRLLVKLSNIEKLGLLAEEHVLKFEQNKLSQYPHLVKRIEHTSKINVSAGYDIQSFNTSSKDGDAKMIYIEVKAVSLTDKKFYWSRNEMEKARTLGKDYYLYLVPVVGSGRFDIKQMFIINNPYIEIIRGKNGWSKTCELMSFEQLKT